ncbi:MAG TPA: JAB domain-containing protein [Fimbriimonadaceae bacterium]|nr:JAB domain-containing protein [Fimbriimonadaceae bacterium]HRJ95152.1 JAB domain-containing protein [Fimbriimonadaceae bacterium]
MVSETPLERVELVGFHAASVVDLLAIARSASPEEVAANEEPARRWLRGRAGISFLANLSQFEVQEISNCDGFEAIRARALIELGVRAAKAGHGEFKQFDGPDGVFKHLRILANDRQEMFWAVYLNAKLGVISVREIHRGTATATLVGVREVFGEALRLGAVCLVVAHNHPSGDPTPSPEDIAITRKLLEAGRLLDVELLDHVIVGHHDFRSLKSLGMLD